MRFLYSQFAEHDLHNLEENEERQSQVDPAIDRIRVVICRKLRGKLDGSSDRNEREGFRGGLVNQARIQGGWERWREREIEFHDSVDEFVGTVRAAEIAPRSNARHRAPFISRRPPKTILIKEPENYTR